MKLSPEDRYRNYCEWCLVMGLTAATFEHWQRVVDGEGRLIAVLEGKERDEA